MEQGRVPERLFLVIPIDEKLNYCESKLLLRVIVNERGANMLIAIPLASKESAFTVFRPRIVPTRQPESDMALEWKLEVP